MAPFLTRNIHKTSRKGQRWGFFPPLEVSKTKITQLVMSQYCLVIILTGFYCVFYPVSVCPVLGLLLCCVHLFCVQPLISLCIDSLFFSFLATKFC